MAEYVQISEVLPFNITEVKTGSELYLLCMINNELVRQCGKELDVSKCKVDKYVVLYSPHWHFVSSQGMNFKQHYYEAHSLTRKPAQERNRNKTGQFYTYPVTELPFDKVEETDTECHYEFNRSLHGGEQSVMNVSSFIVANCTGTPYIAMWAYFLVVNYLNKQNGVDMTNYLYINNANTPLATGEYNDLYILRYEGNRILAETDTLTFSHLPNVQPDMLAYKAAWQQRGFMLEQSSPKQKHALTQRKYAPGDVLLMYEAKDTARVREKENNVGGFVACSIAIIRDITPEFLVFDRLVSPNNRLTAYKEWQCNKAINSMFSSIENSLNKPIHERLAWHRFGIGGCYYNELILFVDVRSEDGYTLWMNDGLQEHQVTMPTADIVYECLKDWNIPFDEEHYLQRCFPAGYTPVHTKFEQLREYYKGLSDEERKEAMKNPELPFEIPPVLSGVAIIDDAPLMEGKGALFIMDDDEPEEGTAEADELRALNEETDEEAALLEAEYAEYAAEQGITPTGSVCTVAIKHTEDMQVQTELPKSVQVTGKQEKEAEKAKNTKKKQDKVTAPVEDVIKSEKSADLSKDTAEKVEEKTDDAVVSTDSTTKRRTTRRTASTKRKPVAKSTVKKGKAPVEVKDTVNTEAKADTAPVEAKADTAPAETKADTAPAEAKPKAPTKTKPAVRKGKAPVAAKADTEPVAVKADVEPVASKSKRTSKPKATSKSSGGTKASGTNKATVISKSKTIKAEDTAPVVPKAKSKAKASTAKGKPAPELDVSVDTDSKAKSTRKAVSAKGGNKSKASTKAAKKGTVPDNAALPEPSVVAEESTVTKTSKKPAAKKPAAKKPAAKKPAAKKPAAKKPAVKKPTAKKLRKSGTA